MPVNKVISTDPGAKLVRLALTAVTGILVVACGGAASASTPAPGGAQSTPLVGSPEAPSGVSSAQPSASAEPTPAGPATPRPTLVYAPPLQPPAVASRIVFADLEIDLPIVSGDLQPPPNYPFCDVAAYVTRFNQPYESGITYISAHAQRGMFAPLLAASERNDGQELLADAIEVYVSDGRLFTYRVERVVRHAIDYAALADLPPTERHLVLQTSEGPYGTIEKLQVIAVLEAESTVDVAIAAPEAMPRDCEPAQV